MAEQRSSGGISVCETGVDLDSHGTLSERDRNPTNFQSAEFATLVYFNERDVRRVRTMNVQMLDVDRTENHDGTDRMNLRPPVTGIDQMTNGKET